ncbi:adapter protein MecA 1/2 [Pelagirhabdus alkalitolerans]|uniref:Adapter protein MecA 1/2 n=1 Tax=Pelagirhabdus alkalitolerans TaxID=1612202 RepID=A0A1G6HC09_9BACI|nr:adaptor protein MecA [Pelagirhabdus alkalitolerans]SDB91485.1 adapter protein MecA 1/2 [Pelagirhabdus alkalitolerans]
MKLERLTPSQFKIFLTFDDLQERGLSQEKLWDDLPLLQALFHDMMFEASEALNFELVGLLSIKVYLLQAQGMLLYVTQEESDERDDYVEMQVTLDESNELLFEFADFEDMIQLARTTEPLNLNKGKVYYYKDHYYLYFKEQTLDTYGLDNMIAILSEFSSASLIPLAMIEEYGKVVLEKDALQSIRYHFKH